MDRNQTLDIKFPMPGKVFKIMVKEGEEVKKGDILVIIEAMKMENRVIAPEDGIIESINVKENQMALGTTTLVSLLVSSSVSITSDYKSEQDSKFNKEEEPAGYVLSENESTVHFPIPGTVFSITVKEGDQIKKGDSLMRIESMKMENFVLSDTDAIVHRILVNVGDKIDSKTVLAVLK